MNKEELTKEIDILKDCLSSSLTILIHNDSLTTDEVTMIIESKGYEGLLDKLYEMMKEIDKL